MNGEDHIGTYDSQHSPSLKRNWLGEPEYFVDASQAAQFIKLHPRTLQHLARCGRVPAHPFGDGVRKTWRFLLSELDAWMRSRVHSNQRRPCSSNGRKIR